MNTNATPPENNDVVIDVAKSRLSDLWTKEDYWAIWLGFLLLIFGTIIFFSNPPDGMQEKIVEAIEIFKLNTEKYPDSWNVYDSLAEAYMKNGNVELAIKNYQKSVEMNPDNENGKEMLEKLAKKK